MTPKKSPPVEDLRMVSPGVFKWRGQQHDEYYIIIEKSNGTYVGGSDNHKFPFFNLKDHPEISLDDDESYIFKVAGYRSTDDEYSDFVAVPFGRASLLASPNPPADLPPPSKWPRFKAWINKIQNCWHRLRGLPPVKGSKPVDTTSTATSVPPTDMKTVKNAITKPGKVRKMIRMMKVALVCLALLFVSSLIGGYVLYKHFTKGEEKQILAKEKEIVERNRPTNTDSITRTNPPPLRLPFNGSEPEKMVVSVVEKPITNSATPPIHIQQSGNGIIIVGSNNSGDITYNQPAANPNVANSTYGKSRAEGMPDRPDNEEWINPTPNDSGGPARVCRKIKPGTTTLFYMPLDWECITHISRPRSYYNGWMCSGEKWSDIHTYNNKNAKTATACMIQNRQAVEIEVIFDFTPSVY